MNFMPFNYMNAFMFNAFNPLNFYRPVNFFRPLNFSMPQFSIFNSTYNNAGIFNNFYSNPFQNSGSSIKSPNASQETNIKTQFVKTEAQNNDNLVFGVKYNASKGQALADAVVEGLPKNRDPQNPLCARYVKFALEKTGLSPYINGNGEYCKYILRANSNFKEVNIKGEDFSKLPVGSVIVYDANDAGYGKNGHVMVTLGDGRGCSDIIEDEIPQSDNAYTFIPV